MVLVVDELPRLINTHFLLYRLLNELRKEMECYFIERAIKFLMDGRKLF